MADTSESSSSLTIGAAICVDRTAFDRFGRVLRHLAVGLIDQAVPLRLLSDDPRLAALTLGPIRTLIYEPISWPATRRRIDKVIEVLHHDSPTVVQAMSADSYRIAGAIAEAFDADLLLEVASMADCDAILHHAPPPNAGFFTISLPFAAVLENQLKIAPDRIHLVRPGLLASREVTCFSHAERISTILCTSPLEREHGVDLLVEAIAILRKKGRHLMAFLLGRGRHEAALRKIVRDHHLNDAVTFASPTGDVGQAMQAADIFVRPSVDTAFSVDLLHAMGAGMVVVTFPNTLLDYLRDGETAVFCRDHNAQSLADALERLMADRTEARRIATNARDHVKTHHAMSTMAEETAAVYRDLALARATFSIRRP